MGTEYRCHSPRGSDHASTQTKVPAREQHRGMRPATRPDPESAEERLGLAMAAHELSRLQAGRGSGGGGSNCDSHGWPGERVRGPTSGYDLLRIARSATSWRVMRQSRVLTVVFALVVAVGAGCTTQ